MKLRPRFTFANVVSCLALFVALGGSAYAASKLAKNSVGTKQLKNASVTGIKIKKGAVGTTQLANGAISGSKVQPGSLTGTQVNSATLGTVQNAAHSATADTSANGARELNFEATDSDPAVVSPNPGAHQLLTLGDLTIAASCINAGGNKVETYVTAASPAHADASWETIRFNNPGTVPELGGTIFGPAPALASYPFSDITGQNHFESGQLVYRTATETITVSFQTASGTYEMHQCDFFGTAVRATS